MKERIEKATRECLLASADAHHIAGQLMVNKVDYHALTDAALQLERTARLLKAMAKETGKR